MSVRFGFCEFQWAASAGSASNGATITPGNNTYGSYVSLMTTAEDAWGIQLIINSVSSSGVARDAMFKLGVDLSGGTSFTDIGIDILCSCASPVGGQGFGIRYPIIPIFFKAGTNIGVAMSVNNATVGTGNAYCRLRVKPSHPELINRHGSAIRSYGTNPGTSSGTPVTPNSSGGKSAFVQLSPNGSIAAGDSPFFWFGGIGCNNATLSNNPSAWDWAIGSSTTVNRVIILDDEIGTSTAETISRSVQGVYAQGNPGDGLFTRAGGPAASVTGLSSSLYGVV